jgi:hypothetical protein
MMKKNELRVGDWVFDYEGYDYQIKGYEIYVDMHEEFEPIPITKEWLECLGFEYNKSHENFRIKAGDYFNSIKYINGEWCYNNDRSDAGCYFVATIKYVHELQNLYFAINKEELVYESARSDSNK